VVTSSDGKRCAVPVQVSSHRQKGRVTRSVLNNIAACLLIDRDKLVDALDTWTHDELRAHLESHTAEELKPPHVRR
jgi:hypothetical protein